MPQTRGVRSVGRTNPPDGLAVNSASALQLSTANITLVSNERLTAELDESALVGPGGDHAAVGSWETSTRRTIPPSMTDFQPHRVDDGLRMHSIGGGPAN